MVEPRHVFLWIALVFGLLTSVMGFLLSQVPTDDPCFYASVRHPRTPINMPLWFWIVVTLLLTMVEVCRGFEIPQWGLFMLVWESIGLVVLCNSVTCFGSPTVEVRRLYVFALVRSALYFGTHALFGFMVAWVVRHVRITAAGPDAQVV